MSFHKDALFTKMNIRIATVTRSGVVSHAPPPLPPPPGKQND
ncbi:hypothetical protein [Dinghuibacter silviterrae]|nr:hypothetical protein [Dinghuibacter silviterrae]